MTIPEANESRTLAPLRRRIWGSFLSALVGWGVLLVVSLFIGTVMVLFDEGAEIKIRYFFYLPMAVGLFSALPIFGTWLLFFLPLYLYVPSHSRLWHWLICTLCGAIAGILLALALTIPDLNFVFLFILGIPGIIVGAVTCLFGSLTRDRFMYKKVENV